MDVPSICRPLLQQLEASGELFTLHYPITYICWPSTPEEAFQHELVELPDNTRVAVLSRCRYGRVVLEYTGLRFAVRYPLLVAHDPASNSYTYTWQTQVFSRNQYPERWQPALAVAAAVADNAAHGFKLQQQQRQQEQQLGLLADITNHSPQQLGTPSSLVRGGTAYSRPFSSSSVRYDSPTRQPVVPGSSSSPKRYGSPLQRQHRGWQQQQHLQTPAALAFAGTPAADAAVRESAAWSQCSSPTRQQQQQQLFLQGSPQHAAAQQWPSFVAAESPKWAAADAPVGAMAPGGSSSSACNTRLPIGSELLQSLPSFLQQQQGPGQQPRQQQLVSHTRHVSWPNGQQLQPHDQPPGGSSNSSHIAAALAQALGHRPSLGGAAASTAAAGGLGRGWWLEPSLLLPSDELLQMVWTREATMVFVQVGSGAYLGCTASLQWHVTTALCACKGAAARQSFQCPHQLCCVV